jgi:hypothetical protein
VIVFVDESGLSQRPHRCRTWAPRGQTPVLQYHFNWKTLSATAGVTWWNFCFRLFPEAIRSPQVVQFSETSPASARRQAVGGLGRIPHASKSFGLRLCPGAEAKPLCSQSSSSRAQANHPGHWLLAQAELFSSLYYVKRNKCLSLALNIAKS